jgi:hypothetical protein
MILLFFVPISVFCWGGGGGGGKLRGDASAFPGKDIGILVLAGLAPSSQKLGLLLRTPWLAKPTRKI